MGKRTPRVDQLAVWFDTPMVDLGIDAVPLCISEPDKWFSSAEADIREAKEICQACPLLEPCFDYATDRANRAVTAFGVWAGTTADERDRFRRKSRRRR